MSRHPAIERADQIGLQGSAPTFQERAFLLNVHVITSRTARTEREAAELFTIGSGAFTASVDLARRQERTDLDYALTKFDRSTEGER